MIGKVQIIDGLDIEFDRDDGLIGELPTSYAQWKRVAAIQEGDLKDTSSLLLASFSTDRRHFLILFPKGNDNMTMLWAGTDTVSVPTMFVTTDNGYEVTDGTVTPLAITNPTQGVYQFWAGELESDQFDWPTGTPTDTETVP